MIEDDEINTIIEFTALAILPCIPLFLFILGIISRQTTYFIYLPTAGAIIIYLLVSQFKKRKKITKINQIAEAPYLSFSGLEITGSEIETVEYPRRR